jgi:hypothetical protein
MILKDQVSGGGPIWVVAAVVGMTASCRGNDPWQRVYYPK